jgi:hypothetical protein
MARTTGTVKHTHQYFRRADGCWACSGIDDCTHYMPRNMSPLPAGRTSICWSCDKPFLLTHDKMRDDKPVCDTCRDELERINQFIEGKVSKVTE